MPAREETGDDLAPDVMLADDDAPDFGIEARDEIGRLVERNEGGRRGDGLCGHSRKNYGSAPSLSS
jgi:hypothetical protein